MVIVCSLLFHGIVTRNTVTAPDLEPIVTVPYLPTPVQIPDPEPTQPTKIEGLATAYCNCKDRMNGETGITASGYALDQGLTYKGYKILASDKKYPFGTLVDITLESGETIHGIVLDRGGKIKGNHFDIVYKNRSKAYEFGVQDITFEIKGRMDI